MLPQAYRSDESDLQGKVALITGASSGIGAAVARRLHHAGVSLGLLSRRGGDLGLDGTIGLECDVRDRAAVERATGKVVEGHGRIDIVIANAGRGSYAPFLELDPMDLEEMVDVNIKGTLYTAAASLPHLVASGCGDFVSVSSVAGLRGLPGEAVYSATKHAQIGFTRSLDHELRLHGVRTTCVCPGGVETGFQAAAGRRVGLSPPPNDLMSPEDAADVIVFALTRPRAMRMLTTTFRPMSEESWG